MFINWCDRKEIRAPGGQSAEKKFAVAGLYWASRYQKKQTTEKSLGALVKQRIQGLGAIPTEIDNSPQKLKGQV
ncbi:hypothetical protein HOY80DRAFT_1041203 [Tuber brumale]|nr:hypothetical protein HOY80DRAFT_1041203 [Tuber brumale]